MKKNVLKSLLLASSAILVMSCSKNYSCKCDVYLPSNSQTPVHSYSSVPVIAKKSKAIEACVDKVVSSSHGVSSNQVKCEL